MRAPEGKKNTLISVRDFVPIQQVDNERFVQNKDEWARRPASLQLCQLNVHSKHLKIQHLFFWSRIYNIVWVAYILLYTCEAHLDVAGYDLLYTWIWDFHL